MGGGRSGAREAEGEWEVRPGGMLVQRRDGEEEGPAIRLRVSHGTALREFIVPAQATFGMFVPFLDPIELPCSVCNLFCVSSSLGNR
jgi:hypothetical protein